MGSHLNSKLLCRESQLKQLAVIHRPIIANHGEYSVNTLILGGPGVGKTLTVRMFAQKFREVALKQDTLIEIKYFDCNTARTKSMLLRKLITELNMGDPQGYSDAELWIQIFHHLAREKLTFLILLDEIGVLPLDDILALLNTSIGFGSSNTRVCFIGITRPDAWYKVETEKIKSRIQEVIKFDAYTLEEAAQILKWRRNLAFRDGVLEDSTIDLMAEMVAESKSMRVGIELMRGCGLHCEEYNLPQITSRDAARSPQYHQSRVSL